MTQKTKMTTNETMPDVIFYDGSDAWTAARHKNVVRYIRADTVTAAVREVEQAIANQTKTMRGIAALIKGRGYDMISAEDQEEAWMREALRLERATDKALAALRGLGE